MIDKIPIEGERDLVVYPGTIDALMDVAKLLVACRDIPSPFFDEHCKDISTDPCDFFVQPAPDFDPDSEASPYTGHYYKRYYNGKVEVQPGKYTMEVPCLFIRRETSPRFVQYRYKRIDIGSAGEVLSVSFHDNITSVDRFLEGYGFQTDIITIGRNEFYKPGIDPLYEGATIIKNVPPVMKFIPVAPVDHVSELTRRFSKMIDIYSLHRSKEKISRF